MQRQQVGALVAVLALAAAAGCSRSDDSAAGNTPPPDAKRVDASRAGHLSGRVTIDGPLPQNPRLDMSGDPACQGAHPDGAAAPVFTGENGGLGNVFVYVRDGLGGYYFDTPAEPVVLDQKGCQYVPRVFGVRAGQRIQFVNGDRTTHNVHALPEVNPEFNFSQPIHNQKDTRSFAKPEVMVRFKCDLHNWMTAFAGVLEHPYYAVTSPGGEFELRNLPAGAYTIEAWHEKLGTRTQTVNLGEKETKSVTFTFKAPAGTGS